MADVKPMAFGEVLDGALTIYRRHFGLFVKLTVLVMLVPASLVLYYRLRFATPEALVLQMENHLLAMILLGFVFVAIYTAGSLMLKAGIIQIISTAYLGRSPELRDAISLGLARIVPMFLVALAKGVILFLLLVVGSVAIGALVAVARFAGPAVAVLGGIATAAGLGWLLVWVLCGYGMTTPVVVLENLGSAFDAFGRSWELTRGFKGKLLGLVVVGWLLSNLAPALMLGALGVYVTLAWPTGQVLVIVLGTFLPLLLAPVLPCIYTLLYYDLRVRREAFDLQLLGERLGIA